MKPLDPKTTALLLIDVINDLDFKGNEGILKAAVAAAGKIARLKSRLTAKGIPVIYVNDNFGWWQSDFRQQIERCLRPGCPGREVAAQLLPSEEDFFVLKPKHSGFYSTSLDVLLGFLGIDTLILTGFASDICVLYTANDAYMRDYGLVVPSDCVAGESVAKTAAALEHMKTLLKAKVVRSRAVA
jgi:nicotinamidase-related amidase